MKNLFLLIFIVALGWRVEAATYYVATNGNNLNPGTLVSPWLTIQKAASTMVAGDVVVINPGLYDERVTTATSGTSVNLIRFVGVGGPVVRGFDLSNPNNNIGIHSLSFTHEGTAINYDPIYIPGCTNIIITDNIFTNVNPLHAAISTDGSLSAKFNNCVIRGNYFDRIGFLSTATNEQPALVVAGTNNLVEYNYIGKCGDYSRFFGYKNVFRNNYFAPITDADFPDAPHVDGMQTFASTLGTDKLLIENNYSLSNHTANSHFYISQDDPNKTIQNAILRGNIILFNGEYTIINDSTPGMKMYHSLVYKGMQVNTNPAYNISVLTAAGGRVATNVSVVNTIFYEANKNSGVVFDVTDAATNTFRGDYVMAYLSGTPSYNWGGHNIVGSDPLLVNPSTFDFHLQAASPARSAAGPLAVAVGSGSSATSLVVNDSRYFQDGWAGVSPDRIKIGSNSAVGISSIDDATHIITLASPLTWANGDSVALDHFTDIAPLPFGSVDLTAAILSSVGTTNTVTTTGDARGVEFYVDGIPTTWVSSAPFTAVITSGVVTAKAYALYAQNTPVVTASATGPSSPTISVIANQAIPQDTSTTALAFTVGDSVDPASSLTVTATSSNHTLADDADCVLGGSGASRTVTITPNGGQTGVTTITLVVTNLSLLTATNTFTLTVTTPSIKVGGNVKKKGRFSVR